MTTAAFANQTRLQRRTDERQELALLAAVALIIVAIGYVLDAPIAGAVTAGTFVVGSALTQVRRLDYGMRRASFVGLAHVSAVIILALSSTS